MKFPLFNSVNRHNVRVFFASLLVFCLVVMPIFPLAAATRIGESRLKPARSRVEGPEVNNRASETNAAIQPPIPSLPAPVPVALAPSIVATMDDGLPAATTVAPGGTINYTVNIRNNGVNSPADDALNVVFNNTIDSHTTLVPGSAMVAVSDKYNTIGNVQISVPDGATDLLGNDFNLATGNNTGMTATAETKSSAQCAACNNVTINANGSFTYNPAVGFSGTDTFTYTAHSGASTATETVTITVANEIWFINNNAGACSANCNGRLSNPFTSLAAFNAANLNGAGQPGDNDWIFVYESGTAYTGPATLRLGQKFIGQDATASLVTLTGFTQPSGTDPLPVMNSANGTIVTIGGTNVNGINLNSGNTLRGFTVGSVGTGTKISGTNFGTLLVGNSVSPDVTLNGTGQALNLTTGTLSVAGKFVSVATTSSATQGISLAGVADSDGAGAGSFSFGSTTVSGSTTQGILIGTTTADLNLGNVSVTNGTAGISFQNNSAGTRTIGTLNVTGGSTNAFLHGAAGGNVTVTGAATLSSANSAVSVSAPGATNAINFQAATSATSTVAGNTAVTWTGVAGASITFNSLTIQRNNGTALNATGGGTVNVTNNTGSINNTTAAGPAIVANGVALSANFSAINSTAGTNGVSLTSVTGTSNFGTGSLTGTATGPTFLVSGGTCSVTYSGGITQATNNAMVSIAGGHNTGTITFQTGTLSATNGTGLQFDNADGIYNFNGTTTLNGGDAGIDILNGSGGTFTFATGTTITNPSGTCFTHNGSTAGVTYSGNLTKSANPSAGLLVDVTNQASGTITFQTGTLSSTGNSGTGIQLSNADGTVNFNGTNTLNGGDAAIDIITGCAGTFTFSTNTALTNPSGIAYNEDTSTANVTYNGTITKNNNANNAVNINAKTGGTTAFNRATGGQITASTSTANAIDLTNTGGIVNFTGGLSLTTTSGVGFNATGSGTTVSATQDNTTIVNTISSTTGTALNVANTTIGASGLTFRSINVTGNNTSPSSGIVLSSTGSGGLKVTGNGGACTPATPTCTGGTIQGTGSHGVSLTSVSNIEFNLTSIHNTGDHGIFGNGVNNFTLRDSFIFDFGDTAGAGVSEDAMHFESTNTANTAAGHGLTGTVIIQRDNIGPDSAFSLTPNPPLPENKGIVIRNHNDLNFNMTVTGTKFFQLSNDGIDAEASDDTDATAGHGAGTINVDGSTADGVNTFSQINGRSVNFQQPIDSIVARTFDLTIKNNSFDHVGIGGRWLASGRGTMNARYNNNAMTFTYNDAIRSESDAVNAALTPHASVNATVSGNTMGGGSIFISLHRGALSNIAFTNNTNIGGTAAGSGGCGSCTGVHTGINLRSDRGSALGIDITGNTGTADGSLAFAQSALDMQATTNGGGNSTICANIGGAGALRNTLTENPDAAGQQVIWIDPLGGSTITIEGGPGGSPGTENFLIANNTLNGTTKVAISTPGAVPSGVGANCVTSTPMSLAPGGVHSVFDTLFVPSGFGFPKTSTLANAGNLAPWNDISIAPGESVNAASYAKLTAPISSVSTSLNQHQLDSTVYAAISRWSAAGLTLQQISTLRGVKFEIGDLQGSYLGEADGNRILVDRNAQGRGWFVDANPTSDFYFARAVSATRLYTDSMSAPAGHIDLLTAIEHEMGHRLGLDDSYAKKDRDSIMYGYLTVGERRVPARGEAASAKAGSLIGSHFLKLKEVKAEGRKQKAASRKNHAAILRALAPPMSGETVTANIGTLPAGSSVTITYQVTVNNPPNLSLLNPPRVSNQGTVTATGGINVQTDDPTVVGASDPTVTLIDLFNTTTTLASDVNPSNQADQVTFTATVNETPVQGSVDPTGTIDFIDTSNGNAVICNDVAVTAGSAQCQTSSLTSGTHNIRADYSGDGNFDPSQSNVVAQVINACTPNPVVTSTADSGAGTLREALTNICTGDTITFNLAGAGPHTITLTTGELAVTKNVTINNNSGESVTVSGNNASRVFNINSGKTVSINNLTITGGSVPGDVGGGIKNSGTLTLSSCNVYGNTAGIAGGISNQGTMTINNCNIGGTLAGQPNTATVNSGGGIQNMNGTLTIKNSSVAGNTASNPSGAGGGITNEINGVLTIVNSTIANNVAVQSGGGINSIAAVTLINSTVSGNHSDLSGGGINTNGVLASLTLINTTISNNRSDFNGDASGAGGGIETFQSTTILRNTIVAGNFRGVGATRDDVDGALDATSSFNLIGDGTGMTGITNGVNSNQVGSSGSPIDAVLGPLANNGGTTQTHLLLPTSPAVNAGSNANLPVDTFDLDGDANTAEPLPVDQRGVGFPRQVGAAVDIGSIEANYTITATAGTPQSAAVGSAFATNLAATVTESGNAVSGVSVTFTAPASGASGTFANTTTTETVTTNGSGIATASQFTANGTPGIYNVVGTATGVPGSANFSLTNLTGAATHFVVSAPGSATAGSAFSFTVTALDQFNNPATGYSGTVHFTSSDGNATLPANSTLTGGTGTFSATLRTAGNQTITASDVVTPSITGTSGTIAVSGGSATHFTVSAPATATAGAAFSFTVTALDQFNNTATGYAGTVHFTSGDGQAVLPANSTLTNGTGTFSATLKTAGNQTLTATDTVTGTINGTSNTIAVSAGSATHFSVSAPATATAGSAFSFTVTALDQFNNTATGYAGTVHFTSSDGNATLPADSTLTNGTGTFSATLRTAGNQTITATDTVTGTINGNSNTIAVSAGAATHFSVSAPASATAGSAFSFTVTAQDQFNNTATGYAGTVHFTSTDGGAVLPANSTLTSGVGTFSATLNTGGNQTITATDAVNGSINGTSNTIAVGAGSATHFTVSAPASATAGSAFSFTVTAQDQFNNTATGYAGTVHFTSTDGQAVLPANSTLTNGTGTFSATLKTAGNQTITATDTVTGTINGTSNTIAVSAAAATHFTVSAPSSATAGSAFSFTVTAQDQFNNTATGYAGTAHFTSSDGNATLPANSTLTNGTGTFSATLRTAGSQTITATDTVTSSITGTSNTITVSAGSATHFSVSAPGSAVPGSAFSFTVTAQDQFNNTATSYAGTVHFTSTDSGAVLPANSTLTNGTGTFSATLNTGGNQTITATDTVNSSITGTSNTILVGNPPMLVLDAKSAEPSSGTTQMLFAVILSTPAAQTLTVDYATAVGGANPANVGTCGNLGVDYQAASGTLTFNTGNQIKIIPVTICADAANEPDETLLLNLTNYSNLVRAQATGTILANSQPGTVLISELRTSGPAGAGDDFVEIYNNSDSPHTVDDGSGIMDASHGYGLYKTGADCSATPVLIGVIPNGTVIPERGHYLFVGSAYSLANYGGTGAAAGDQTMLFDIESDRNVALFSTGTVTDISSANRLDAVGFGSNTGGVCDLLREGTTLSPMVGSVLEYSFFRDECGKKGDPAVLGPCSTGGFVKDSNVNADDLVFVETTAAVTVAGQRLGAPSPQNLASPLLRNSTPALLIDSTVAAAAVPNRVRDLAAVQPNAANGTLTIRRRFVNNSGAPVTRLRFRIMDISAFVPPGAIADVRALSSGAIAVNGIGDSATCLASNGVATTPCTITVQGTTLETPPAQPLGGGLNSSMSAGTITLATPLAAGASINLQFLLGVQQTGLFKFIINIEALGGGAPAAPTTTPIIKTSVTKPKSR